MDEGTVFYLTKMWSNSDWMQTDLVDAHHLVLFLVERELARLTVWNEPLDLKIETPLEKSVMNLVKILIIDRVNGAIWSEPHGKQTQK